jgi:hypothetical protein
MSENQKPEDILDVNKAWLPPSPHIDRVVEMVIHGRAYIEHRGHELPPLVVFEDGGVIELPNVRYEETHRGIEIISAVEPSTLSHTRHPDVCGCVDELRGLVDANPNVIGADPEKFHKLMTDAIYMIARMKKRIDTYEKFFDDVINVCKTNVDIPDTKSSSSAAEQLHSIFDSVDKDQIPDKASLFNLAEQVRDVASGQEAALAKMRSMAVKIGELYNEIKGARNW